MTKQQLVQVLTPILTPLLIAFLKAVWPKVPNKALPILAPIIGAAIDLCASGTLGAGTAWGAALGSAGVGVREAWDQLTGSAAKPSRLDAGTNPIPGIKLMLWFLIPALLVGCNTGSQRMSRTKAFDASGKVLTDTMTTDTRVRNYMEAGQQIENIYSQHGPETQATGASGIKQQSTMGTVLLEAWKDGLKTGSEVAGMYFGLRTGGTTGTTTTAPAGIPSVVNSIVATASGPPTYSYTNGVLTINFPAGSPYKYIQVETNKVTVCDLKDLCYQIVIPK